MRIFTIIILLLMVSFNCYADFQVIYDKNTKEIYYMGNTPSDFKPDDETRFSELTLTGDVDSYPLEYPLSYYKVSGNKIIVNVAKISQEENKNQQEIEKANKKNADFESAKQKLIGLGLTSDEVDSLR